MVGDEAACRRAFADLRDRVSQLHLAELDLAAERNHASGASAPSNPWQALVPRFRALRESLTSEGVAGALVVEAYEAAAEACLRAGDLGEYLKCQARVGGCSLACLTPPLTRCHSNA